MNRREFLKKTLEGIILGSIPLISSCGKNPVDYNDNIIETVESLVKNSHDIVEGKVAKVEQKWDEDYRMIYTYTTVQINLKYKNNIEQNEIIVKHMGGNLDGFTTWAPGQPEYKLDENVLSFLKKDGNYYNTVGWDRGKFNIGTIKGEKILLRYITPGTDIMTTEKREENIYNYSEFIKVLLDFLAK